MNTDYPIFPTPQQLSYSSGAARLSQNNVLSCCIFVSRDASEMELQAALIVRDAIGKVVGAWPDISQVQYNYPIPPADPADPTNSTVHPGIIPIVIGEAARAWLANVAAPEPTPTASASATYRMRTESYVLHITPTYIALRGVGNSGTLYAAHTLAQLISVDSVGVRVPALTVYDHPDMAWRGLYVECKWGSDRMTLVDWQALIDYMASLKMNLLGVGVYGTWEIQYDEQVTEFLMLPIPGCPDLHTEKTIHYYSPKHGGWKSESYLPPMFSEDFLGAVVKYGRSRNVTVRPHFNCLGHNTLIPRLYPELSAKDANGWSTGYSFCLSNPTTVKFMQVLLEDIAKRYLLPYGVDSFHLGMDEVYEIKGVYPHHPQQKVSPWCRCPACRCADKSELVTNYLLGLAQSLRSCGIENITIWHDQLQTMGLLDETFAQRVQAAGLGDNLIINWWRYSNEPFNTILPELGLRRCVTPMTGYYFWSPIRSHYKNIEAMCRLGAEQGAEGAESYGTHDPAFEGYQRYLADCAWNSAAVESHSAWLSKLAAHVFGRRRTEGEYALRTFDAFVADRNVQHLFHMLDHYRYSYVDSELPYPRQYPAEALVWLRSSTENHQCLSDAVALATDALRAMSPWVETAIPRVDLITEWLVELRRAIGLLRIFTLLLEATECMSQGQANPNADHSRQSAQRRESALVAALEIHDQTAAYLEKVKAHYLLPQLLRNWSAIRPYLTVELATVRNSLDQ